MPDISRSSANPPPYTPDIPRGAAAGAFSIRRKGVRIMIYVLIALVGWMTFAWFVQRSILFPRWIIPPTIESTPAQDIQVIHIDTPEGQVEGWFIPGQGVSVDNPGPAVIFAHGNGELIDHWQDELRPYQAMGISVLLPEYRGYGRSAGSPSEKAIISDFKQFYDWLAERDQVDADRIIYHGRSLGGGVLATLGRDRPPAAIILQSAFLSVPHMARRYLIPPPLVRDHFNTLGFVEQYDGPVLIMHGTADEVVPNRHAHRLHDAAADSNLILYDISHNVLPPADAYWRDIQTFLKQAAIIDER